MNRPLPRTLLAALAIAAAVAPLAGCGAPRTSYVHPNVDFGYMRRAAVLPFRNLSPDELAGDRLQSIFVIELLAEDALEILDPRETVAALRDLRIPPGSELTADQAVAVGEKLGVDALFFGTVEEYGVQRGDRSRGPEVTATFGMLETQTGVVVWRAQVHATGGSIWRKIFGGSPADVYHVSRRTVRAALDTLL